MAKDVRVDQGVNADAVIKILSEQITALTIQNALLRAQLEQSQSRQLEAVQ